MPDQTKSVEDALKEAMDVFAHGNWMDASSHCRRILKATDLDKKIEGKARMILGHSLRRLGRYDDALEQFILACKIAEELSDRSLKADCLLGRGFVTWRRGDLKASLDFFEKAKNEAENCDEHRLKAKALIGLADAYVLTGDLDRARDHFNEALEIIKPMTDMDLEKVRALHNLGFVLYKLNFEDDAILSFRKCAKISQDLGDLSNEGMSLMNLAKIEILRDNLDEAGKLLEKAGMLLARNNDKVGMAGCIWVKGLLSFYLGKHEQAISHYDRALESYEDMNLPAHIAEMNLDYIPVFKVVKGEKEARAKLSRAKEIAKRLDLGLLKENLKKAEKDL